MKANRRTMPARTVFLIRSESPNWDGLRLVLDALSDVTVVGDTTRADDAHMRIPILRPDIIITAMTLDGASAIPLLTDLRAQLTDALIVVLAGRYSDDELAMLSTLHVAGYFVWADLDEPTFPAAHEALRSGAFTVLSRGISIADDTHVILPRPAH